MYGVRAACVDYPFSEESWAVWSSGVPSSRHGSLFTFEFSLFMCRLSPASGSKMDLLGSCLDIGKDEVEPMMPSADLSRTRI